MTQGRSCGVFPAAGQSVPLARLHMPLLTSSVFTSMIEVLKYLSAYNPKYFSWIVLDDEAEDQIGVFVQVLHGTTDYTISTGPAPRPT